MSVAGAAFLCSGLVFLLPTKGKRSIEDDREQVELFLLLRHPCCAGEGDFRPAFFSLLGDLRMAALLNDVVGQMEFPKRYVAATPSLILQADSPRRAARGTDRHVDQAGK